MWERVRHAAEFIALQQADEPVSEIPLAKQQEVKEFCLNLLESWLCATDQDEQSLQTQDMLNFFTYLRQERGVGRYISVLGSTLRRYFAWLVNRGLRADQHNPALRIFFDPYYPEEVILWRGCRTRNDWVRDDWMVTPHCYCLVSDETDDATAYVRVGKELTYFYCFSEAIEAFHEALHRKPKQAQTYLYLGIAYKLAGASIAAARAFSRANHLQPGYVEAQYGLALAYLDEKGERELDAAKIQTSLHTFHGQGLARASTK